MGTIEYKTVRLTPMLWQTLIELHDILRREKVSPTYSELALYFDRAPNAIHERMKRLRREGLVDWIPAANRTLHVTDLGEQMLRDKGEW